MDLLSNSLSDIGALCFLESCHQHTYSPFTCKYCHYNFCQNHIHFIQHQCSHQQQQNAQLSTLQPKINDSTSIGGAIYHSQQTEFINMLYTQPSQLSMINIHGTKISVDILKDNDDFNVDQECSKLHHVIGIFTTKRPKGASKKAAFGDIICNTNTEQRQKLKEHYNKKYHVNLDHYINMFSDSYLCRKIA